jgi:hypothetical protein
VGRQMAPSSPSPTGISRGGKKQHHERRGCKCHEKRKTFLWVVSRGEKQGQTITTIDSMMEDVMEKVMEKVRNENMFWKGG